MDLPDIPTSLEPVVMMGVNIAKAIVFLIVGWIAAGWISGAVRRRLAASKRVDRTLGVFFSSIVRYVLLAAVGIAVLQTFGFQVTSLVAVLGAATLAVGLAMQGTLSHLAAGVMLVFFRPYKIDDFVEVGGNSGTITDLNLFLTELTTVDGVKIFVPNGEAWGKPITNYSVNPKRRCDITFGIDYTDDIDKAIDVILGVAKADERFVNDPAAPWVRVVNLGDSSVDLQLRAWCKASDLWEAKFATIKAVKEAFDKAGISIPYPHRTIEQKSAA
ncbi:mechanosensitive ion channel family protein [Microbaculum marinisediminis]|uniref:Small-conductance mechanosensitive channel n=1 Tax=Microbaculum marinisediminis TaxID=2931392 RepID=A0AAW5QWS0_9HYPH|nr:mechanosensitive ion channel domain-containing protein [Microbaculum sp. A6E488]MCT8970774.1 mechanosensitive ion channel [Microbaculum sp. A6E488]